MWLKQRPFCHALRFALQVALLHGQMIVYLVFGIQVVAEEYPDPDDQRMECLC